MACRVLACHTHRAASIAQVGRGCGAHVRAWNARWGAEKRAPTKPPRSRRHTWAAPPSAVRRHRTRYRRNGTGRRARFAGACPPARRWSGAGARQAPGGGQNGGGVQAEGAPPRGSRYYKYGPPAGHPLFGVSIIWGYRLRLALTADLDHLSRPLLSTPTQLDPHPTIDKSDTSW